MTDEKAEFKIEENPDVNLCSALAVIRHPDVYIWVDHDVDDGTKDVKLAHQIAALLRFQSAMTPEMWEDAIAMLGEEHGPDRDEPDCPVCKALAALDTLRQALGELQP